MDKSVARKPGTSRFHFWAIRFNSLLPRGQAGSTTRKIKNILLSQRRSQKKKKVFIWNVCFSNALHSGATHLKAVTRMQATHSKSCFLPNYTQQPRHDVTMTDQLFLLGGLISMHMMHDILSESGTRRYV